MKKSVSVEVEASIFDVIDAVANLVKAIRENHKAGANLAVAIPMDIQAAIADLAPVIGKVGSMKDELTEDRAAAARAAALGGVSILEAVIG